MHVESVRSWEKSSSCLRQHTDCPSCAGLKCRLPSKRSETNKRKTRNTECLWHEGKFRERLFPWQGDPDVFFFFLLRREQICNALCYLANAEVAVWELSDWADRTYMLVSDGVGAQHCLSAVPNYRDKTQSYCWHKQDRGHQAMPCDLSVFHTRFYWVY